MTDKERKRMIAELWSRVYKLDDIIKDENKRIEDKIDASNEKGDLMRRIKSLEKSDD